jgi:4'-phosphopantetheinyl transferase EntD
VAARSGWRSGIRSIGLDAEAAVPLPAGVLDVVASHHERTGLERLGSLDPDTPWDTVLFTAKEAAYKAWYPLTGVVLAHDDIEVRLSGDRLFVAEVRAPAATGHAEECLRVRGRWALGLRRVVSLGVVG